MYVASLYTHRSLLFRRSACGGVFRQAVRLTRGDEEDGKRHAGWVRSG